VFFCDSNYKVDFISYVLFSGVDGQLVIYHSAGGSISSCPLTVVSSIPQVSDCFVCFHNSYIESQFICSLCVVFVMCCVLFYSALSFYLAFCLKCYKFMVRLKHKLSVLTFSYLFLVSW